MKYYVEQKYYDNGAVEAQMLLESEVIGVPSMEWHAGATPNESRFKELSGYDLYVDVFESYEEAEEFYNDALNA